MPILTPGKPITVDTPELLVENQLAVGVHRFQLVVIDEAGLESEPRELAVTVRRIRPIGRPDVIVRPDLIDRPVLRPDVRIVTGDIRPPRRPQ